MADENKPISFSSKLARAGIDTNDAQKMAKARRYTAIIFNRDSTPEGVAQKLTPEEIREAMSLAGYISHIVENERKSDDSKFTVGDTLNGGMTLNIAYREAREKAVASKPAETGRWPEVTLQLDKRGKMVIDNLLQIQCEALQKAIDAMSVLTSEIEKGATLIIPRRRFFGLLPPKDNHSDEARRDTSKYLGR